MRSIGSTSSHRSSVREKLFWGAGGMTESLVNSIYALAFPIFGIGLGVSAFLIGLAKAIPRLLDAFTDPVMGNISDNTRTRWGRRRPYIFWGAIGIGLLMPLIYMPIGGLSELGLFFWFVGFLSLFYVAYTVWGVPWAALGLELSSDYHDRTRLQVSRMVFSSIGGLGAAWVYKLCFLFSPDETVGVRPVVMIVGGLMLVFGLMAALGVREWRKIDRQPRIRIGAALKMTLSNRPFLLLSGSILTFATGTMLVEPMLLYVNIFHVFGGVETARSSASTIMGISGTMGVIISTICLPIGGWLSSRIGKKNTAYLALSLILVGKGAQFWTLTPQMPYLQLVSRMLFQPGILMMWALIPSMIADVCDLDEARNGYRREASFSSVYQWIVKLGATSAMVVGGFLLSFAGAGKVQAETVLTPQTILSLRLMLAIVPACFALVAMFCIWKYPLSEAKIRQMQSDSTASIDF